MFSWLDLKVTVEVTPFRISGFASSKDHLFDLRKRLEQAICFRLSPLL